MSSNSTAADTAANSSTLRKVMVVLAPFLIIGLCVLLTVLVIKMRKKPEVQRRAPPVLAVRAVPAVSDTVQLKVNVQGETRPRTEIDLVPEVGGKITYVSPKFLSGGLFAKGDVLYRIEEADYKVAVVRAEAAVARAQQVLVRERAESEIARKDWEDLGEGPASDLTLRKPQLLEAQAGLQSAQADLDNALLRLERTAVRAPFDGRVREKFADIGQYVNPGSRLGRIFSTDFAEVRLALSDSDLARLDLPVAFVAQSRADAPQVLISAVVGGKMREWNGQIMRTDSTFDTATRSLFAIAEVADPYGKGAADGGIPLAPGMYVNASISGKVLESVMTFPRGGLRPEDKIYVVDMNGKADVRSASVLDANPNRAVVASGVAPGELVILSPLERSQLSMTFKVLDARDPDIVLVEPKRGEKDGSDKDGENTADAVSKQGGNKAASGNSGADQ